MSFALYLSSGILQNWICDTKLSGSNIARACAHLGLLRLPMLVYISAQVFMPRHLKTNYRIRCWIGVKKDEWPQVCFSYSAVNCSFMCDDDCNRRSTVASILSLSIKKNPSIQMT